MRETFVYSALRKPRLSYGVSPRALGIVWGPPAFIGAILAIEYGWQPAVGPMSIGLVIHTVVQWMFKKDYRVFEIYARYANLADEYHPHPRGKLPAPFERPIKMGRGSRI